MKLVKGKRRTVARATLLAITDLKVLHTVYKLLASYPGAQLPSHVHRVRKNERKAEILLGIGYIKKFESLTQKLLGIEFSMQEIELVVDGLELEDQGWNYRFSFLMQQRQAEYQRINELELMYQLFFGLLDRYDALLADNGYILAVVDFSFCYFPTGEPSDWMQVNVLNSDVKCERLDACELGLSSVLFTPVFALPRIKDLYLANDRYSLTGLTVLCKNEPDALEAGALLHSRVREVIYLVPQAHGCLNETYDYGELYGSNHKFNSYQI